MKKQELKPLLDFKIKDHKAKLQAFLLLFLFSIFIVNAQCNEVIPPGNPTSQIANNDITWIFSGTGPAGAIILNGISIAGEPNTFTDLITPDNVLVNVQNLNTSKKVQLNGAVIADGNLGLAEFSSFVLAEAQDTNLNHYLKFDTDLGGTVQGDYVDYLYDTPIIAAKNRYVIATERGGNNTSSTQALDINGNPIGVKAMNTPGVNYYPTGATHDNGQLVRATVFPMTALVSRTTLVYGIRYMQEDNGDGADGQAFIMRDPATIGCTITAQNDDFSATPIAAGNATPSVFLDNGNGVDEVNEDPLTAASPATNANIADNISITDNGGIVGLTINTDGTINIPVGTPTDYYTVEYQVCLEIDNSKCDTAIVEIFVLENFCDEIIPPGNPTSQVANNDITWSFSGTGPAGAIILNGISIAGEPHAFTDLITPDSVLVNVQNLDTSKKVQLNGAVIADGNLGLAAFSSFVLAEAQDTNLNHYLKFDSNSGGTVQGDYVDYLYDTPIVSAKNRYVIATERGGNNTSSTQALDINGNPIGVKAMNTPGVNYYPTGATHDNGQLVRATVFPMTALVSRATLVYGIRYMQEDNGDGADGQAFIMRDPATIGCTITAQNDDFSATPIAAGNATPSVFLDNGNGVDDANGNPATNANIADNISITDNNGITGLAINPDGTIDIPVGINTGTYTIEYQICLDIDSSKCDTATVTFSVTSTPDFSPTILSGNTTIIGSTGVVDFRVLIGEYGNGNSNGVNVVELRMVKNPNLVISFDNNLTTLDGQAVSNNQWQYDGSHPTLHKFIFLGNGGVFSSGTAQIIGINATYNPTLSTIGTFPLKATIKSFSGGEINNNNNNDIDYIEYSNN